MNIKENDIFLNLKASSKGEAIKLTGEKLLANGYIDAGYIDGMLAREELTTTYIGLGFAIPHGTNESKKYVKNSGLAVLQFPEGVDFDGEKAYILIGIAGVGDEHLEILSNIAVLLDDDLTEVLKNANDKNIFLNTLK